VLAIVSKTLATVKGVAAGCHRGGSRLPADIDIHISINNAQNSATAKNH